MKRSRISEVLLAEGLKWRQEETWFGARVDPEFTRKRGRSSNSTPRHHWAASSSASRWDPLPARATQASASSDQPHPMQSGPAKRSTYGRRGKGYAFGACCPATGAAFTATYEGRTAANWVDFLAQVEG